MTDKVENKQVDVLDDIKNAEKKIKRAAFLKLIPKLKIMAKEVNTLKKKADFLLVEVGIEEKDIKRVIDFINSLRSVELSENDIKELKEEVKEQIKETTEKTEKDFEKSLEKFYTYSTGNANYTSGSNITDGTNMVLTASGNSLNVDI